MKYKYLKQVLKVLLRTIALVLLGCEIARMLNVNFEYKVDLITFYEKGLLDIREYIYMDMPPTVNFIKMMVILSFGIINYLDTIIFVCDSYSGYNLIVKYHSENRRTYLVNRVKQFTRYYLKDSLLFIVTIIIFCLLCLEPNINVSSIIKTILILVINYLAFLCIYLLSFEPLSFVIVFNIVTLFQCVLHFNTFITLIILIIILGLSYTNIGSTARRDES